MRCRKNQATLTAAEKSRFVRALLKLKGNGTYDRYVAIHEDAMNSPMMYAHRGPAFPAWHREFLRRFELDLQSIDSGVTLPYWDWSVDSSPVSSIWNADFMGGDGRPSDGRVMTGAFAFDAGNWTLTHGSTQDLKRRFGVGVPTLPTPGDVTATLNALPYDVPNWDMFSGSGFRNTLEGWINGPQMHNRVHVWVGGSMLPGTSPNDPVFFLNHCFVDKLWADWQRLHPSETYLPSSGAMAGQNLDDAMEPWASLGETVTPRSLLDHQALGYAYDNERACSIMKSLKHEKIEIKETFKIEKVEWKEHKAEKVEVEKFHLPKEKVEWKEVAALEKSPAAELKLGALEGPIWGIPEEIGDPLRAAIEKVQDALTELTHFITPQLRPDLTRGALAKEEDLGPRGPSGGPARRKKAPPA